MTTLSDITGLVSKLIASLQQGGPTAVDRDLADQYADACASANGRLVQCARMIDEGSSMQALMLAEEKPNLLDTVAALSFAKSAEWHDACGLNALRQATKIDRNAVHKLNELYNRGSRADQTKALYKEYRAAMASKDDSAALDIIRTITRLDPADADAAKELARLERKRRDDSLKQLEVALAGGDEAQILSGLEDCERLEVSEAPAVAKAKAVRTSARAREAQLEADAIVPQLDQLRLDGLWQQCGERANRVVALAANHGFKLSGEQLSLVRAATEYFESCRQDALRDAQFKDALSSITERADQIQHGTQVSSKSSLESLEESRLRLRKAYEKAKEFMLPIPDALVARVSQLSANLDSEIDRLRKARRVRNTSLAVAGFAALLVTVGTGYFFLKASQYAGELLALKSAGKAKPLQQLVGEIRSNQSAYLSVPALSSAVLESESWLQSVEAQNTATKTAIDQANALASVNFEAKTAEQAHAVFEQARKALQQMPADMADDLRPSLSEAEGKLAIWFVQARDQRIEQAKSELEKARELAGQLDLAGDAEEIRNTLKPLTETVRGLLAIRETPVKEVRPSEAMQTEIANLGSKVESNAELLKSYDSAMAQVKVAKSIEDFSTAITALAEVKMPRSQMVKAAQFLTTKKLDSKELLGSLVLPSAPDAWTALKGPEELRGEVELGKPREAERNSLRELINDDNLVGIYESQLQERTLGASSWSQRKIFSRGPMRRSNATGSDTTASGIVYDPALSGSRVSFKEEAYAYISMSSIDQGSGKRVVDEKESATSQAMGQFALKSLLSDDGSRYEESLLAAMDRVKTKGGASPLARAYVLQELYAIAMARPADWGLAWVPSFDADVQSLREAAGGKLESGDWMIPAKAGAADSLKSWFKSREGKSYVAQQKLTRALALAAFDAGLSVVGYVDQVGNFAHTSDGGLEGVTELWGLEKGSAKPIVAFRRTSSNGNDGFVASAAAQALSPVFIVPGDRGRLLEAALDKAQITAKDADNYALHLPPLFMSGSDSSTLQTQ
jgi:hypothetical protein